MAQWKGFPPHQNLKDICGSNKSPNCDAGGLVRGKSHIEQLFRLSFVVHMLEMQKIGLLVDLI